MARKVFLLTLLLCLGATTVAVAEPPGSRSAGAARHDVNQITAVAVDERDDGTWITVQGNQEPTYSAFTLNSPLRLFVDISNSKLTSGVRRAPVSVKNGHIDQVAVLDFADDVQQVTRVIVSFDNKAAYDVKTDGNNVIIFVEAAARRGQGDGALTAVQQELDQREGELDQARRALLEKERRLAEVERRVQDLEGQARRATDGSAEQQKLNASLDAERRAAQGLRGELQEREARLRDLERTVASMETRVGNIQKERDNALSRASSLEQQLSDQKAQLTRLQQERDEARQRADQLAKDRDAARKHSEQLSASIEQGRRDLERLERDLASARSDVKASSDANRKANEERLARVEAEKRDLVARVQRAEKDRADALANSQRIEDDRLKALAESRKAEERRLAAVESSRKEEEARLADTREELARQEKARVEAERRLADTQAAYQRELERVQLLRNNAPDDAQLKQDQARLDSLKREIEQEQTHLKKLQDERAQLANSEAPKKDDAKAINTIRAIRFQENDGISRIVVEMDRAGDFATVPWKEGKAGLSLSGVSLPTSLERSLDTRAFGGTVHFVNSFQDDKGIVHVEALVPGATTEMVRQEGNKLYWEFSSIGAESTALANPAPAPANLPHPQGFTAEPPRFVPAASRALNADDTPPWQRRPQGMARKRLTIDLRGSDIDNTLRLMAREGGVNIVSGGDVKGTVTMRLQNVPVADAFVTILKSLELGYEQDGEIIRVAPAKSFEEEAKRRQDAVVSSFKLDPLEVVLIPINYANAEEVSTLAKQVLSNRGSATVDQRTNTLIVKDVARNIAAVQQLVLSLDAQTPQILIEARIVETNDRFVREIGVQWGGDFLFSPANGNSTGLAFPSVVGVAGAATDNQTPLAGLAGSPNFAVNLPAPIGTGAGGGFGVTLGSVGGAANLALRLTALEEDGHIKIVSSPKVLTLDNRQATISQGTSIPISVVSAQGVQTVFVEARLQLQVQPHVTQDGNIQLRLNITKSEPDFENTGARGDPTIIRKEATTELLLGDGDTTVIGGIYSQTTGTSSSKVPFFGDIPILGFFFRDFSESESRTELLIFVTPRIINREAALTARRLSPIQAPEAESKKP